MQYKNGCIYITVPNNGNITTYAVEGTALTLIDFDWMSPQQETTINVSFMKANLNN